MATSHVAYSQTYIYDPPGSLTGFTNVNNWGLESDENTHPANFTDANQIFVIDVTSGDATLDADWTVSGSGSKVVIGNGTNSTTFIIPEGFSYTGTIDVDANSTLQITNNSVPTMGTLATTSTVIYNENEGTPNQIIATGTYGNLTIEQLTPIKELQTSIVVAGDLTFNNTEFTVTSAATLTLDGDLTLLQTVTFDTNVKNNLSITHTGNSVQTITASSSTGTIPCNDFFSSKSGGSLTLASSPVTTLDIGGDFTIDYAGPATFTDNGNTVNVGGTFTLSNDGNKNIPAGTFQNLTVNLSTGNGILQGAATVNGTLTLTSGSIELGSNDLTIGSGGSISGFGSSNYIITNGGGELFFTIGNVELADYPIGTSGSYTPVRIFNGGSTGTFSARVFGDVLTEGTSGTTVAEIEDLVNRTWSINSASSGFDVTLRFQWNASDEGSTFNRTDGVKIIRYSGGAWSDITSPAAPTGSDPYTISVSGITSFSEFTLGDAGSSLPVTWLSFSGEEVQEGIASLEWKTVSELNNEGFEVQKSVDGKNYEVIGFVAGAGTTNEIQTYGFTDENLQQNTYYRLKQIDFDGKFDYSRIIFVESSRHIAHPFTVYPNPVNNNTPLRLIYQLATDKSQSLQLQLHDVQGSLLLSVNGTIDKLNDVLNARLGHMAQGMYVLTLSDFATLTRLKVLKQ